jgi:hypothetical protein
MMKIVKVYNLLSLILGAIYICMTLNSSFHALWCMKTLVTPTATQFWNLCILSITRLPHILVFLPSSGRLYQSFIKTYSNKKFTINFMCNLMLFIFYWIGSSFDQERTDVCKQVLSVRETYTSLNHSNKHYIITVLTTLFYI